MALGSLGDGTSAASPSSEAEYQRRHAESEATQLKIVIGIGVVFAGIVTLRVLDDRRWRRSRNRK